MSDIIYTPPASGGGGTTINPTNDFIPVRSNATTFVDSFILNDSVGQVLFTTFNLGGDVCGIYIDNLNKLFGLGDFGFTNNGTYLKIDDTNQSIETINQGNSVGLYLSFANNNYYLGDFNDTVTGTSIACTSLQKIVLNASALNNGTTLELDDINQSIKTSNQGNDKGLKLDFANNQYAIGQYQSGNVAGLSIDLSNSIYSLGDIDINGNYITYNGGTFKSVNGGSDIGLKLDFVNTTYLFGDYNGINKNTYFAIDDGNEKMTFRAQFLNFVGATLQSNTSSGNSGEHLVIVLNGNTYKIKLELP